MNNFNDDIDDSWDDSSTNSPKLIELDGYRPTMSLIHANRSIETIRNVDLTPKSPRAASSQNAETYLFDEFCRFYKLRPFMTWMPPVKSEKNYRLKNNLVYFTQTSINEYLPLRDEHENVPKMCTSCLFIYLYRTIHRRADFFYVRDHLPKCFINLHFKDDQSLDLLNTSADKFKHLKYIKSIEESFRVYWKLLGCSDLTGLSSILHYNPDVNESDETRADYETIDTRCRRSSSNNDDEVRQIGWMEADAWHENAVKICARNLLNSKPVVGAGAKMSPGGGGLGGLRRMSKRPQDLSSENRTQSKVSFNITFLVVALFSFFTVIFIYFKYYKVKKPCIRINLRHNTFRRLENPSQIRYYNTTSSNRQRNNSSMGGSGVVGGGGGDDDEATMDTEHPEASYDAYEYDDEFETINEGHSKLEIDNNDFDDDGVVIQRPPAAHTNKPNVYTALNDHLEFDMQPNATTTHHRPPTSSHAFESLRDKSMKKIRRLKDGLLQATKPRDLLRKFPNSNYNSTDSTYLPTITTTGGLELAPTSSSKTATMVIYDSKRKQTQPNVIAAGKQEFDETDGSNDKDGLIRLAMNPLDDIEFVENKTTATEAAAVVGDAVTIKNSC